MMMERNGSEEEGFQVNGCSSEPGGLEEERETRMDSVTEMKNNKTLKVVDREVNITRKVLRSGSVATDGDKHDDVAVEEKGDLSEVDNIDDCFVDVDEVKEGKALLCMANDTEKSDNNGVAVEEDIKGDLSEVDKVIDEVKEEAKPPELVESPLPKESLEAGGKEAQVKRKRGRPRKLHISSQSDGNGDQVICVIEEEKEASLRAESTSQVEVEIKKDGANDENGHAAEELKVKRKRGRPRKVPITGQSDTNCEIATTPDTGDSKRPKRICGGRDKGPESDGRGRKVGRKRGRPKTKKKPRERDESDSKATKRLKRCENRPLSDSEVRNGEKENDDGRRSKLESKKKLSDRILQLLLAAGWTVEYRPRNGKSYNAAVYVNPEGKTHWSVTKAYEVYKMKLELSMTDQVDSGLGLLPEEDLDLLRRKAQKKRSDTGKPRSKNWKDTEDKGSRKGVGEKSKKKRKGSHNSERSSVSVRRIKRGENHNRKRGALSARSSLSDADSNENGYILFEGKRTVLGWMVDSAIVPLNGKVQCMNCENTEVLLEGMITKEGIRCNCCDEVFSVLDFEVHSGGKHNQPFKSLYLEGGNSLLQCFLESWNKQSEAVLKGFHDVDFGSGDQNDDTCGICGDGGDLTCCDGCPSTFHQSCLGIKKFPSGSWFCCYCSCKFCEKVEAANHGTTTLSPLLRCHLCEEKYHEACIKQDGTVPVESSSTHPFCGKYCQELFDGLQLLIGVKHSLPEGFSWTFLRRFEIPREEVSDSEKIAYNAKLAVAFSVMDECFSPLVDHRSGVNLLENIVYNFGSNFHRLNYSNFLTAVLERGDEIIAVASIRIHGNQLAEMPFIGTRYMYRRQGMCRRLMNGIESALGSLKVDKLVIPAVPELMDTWTKGFGFTSVRESARKTIKNLNLVVFPGVDMLEKSLAKDNGELLLAAEMSLSADVEESKPEECKAGQNCASADVESHCYQVDSGLKSMDVDNDKESNLKLLTGSLEEKEEIGIGKLTDKAVDFLPVAVVDSQRESNSGVNDDSHEDQTGTKRLQSGDLKSSGVNAEGTEEPDEVSDCYIIENSQPLGNGGSEKKIGNKALSLKKGVTSRLRVSPRLIQGAWGTSRVNKRYTGTSALLIGSSHGRCV
ncbi:Acyl-CoA N-acyltransferase with RING/FYVE/PHD-type zinc finger protein [Hirschfeldia incana]|nr:Acyl-CoA N-acyltransferase with RING/FYVE/PHD-type zinc finger protein [Hirschfeldia incana]